MIRSILISVCAIFALTQTVGALELDLPSSARQTVQINSKLDSYAAPFGSFRDGGIESRLIEGEVRRSAWRIATSGATTLQVLAPLREQLTNDGYITALDCDQASCGGFDFRFEVEVLPAPDMYVNIRAFRFITVYKGDPSAPSEIVSLLVSTTETEAFVQIIQAGRLGDVSDNINAQTSLPSPSGSAQPLNTSLESELLRNGTVVLRGLEFGTGTSDLGQGPFAILKDLAAFLASRNDVRLVLVGHTDSVGSLDANIALSKRRAASVRKRLLEAYGMDASRIGAEGNGYLAPLRSNLNNEGRAANRRVEAVVLPLE